ncbi:MAG: hypothetical protein Nk1A_9070 [Endomicrobiia bacterium]|nr:MAG: hypothetical protein Nk1A_9070 [Endomicrobiia bacterium]
MELGQTKHKISERTWLIPFLHPQGYDDAVKVYDILEKRKNPRFKEITVEIEAGSRGRQDYCLVDIISDYEGKFDRFITDPQNWLLGEFQSSQFRVGISNEWLDDLAWLKEALIWWRDTYSTIQPGLFYSYVTKRVHQRCAQLREISNYSVGNYFHDSLVEWLRINLNLEGSFDYIEKEEELKLLFLFYTARYFNLPFFKERSKLLVDAGVTSNMLEDERAEKFIKYLGV